MTELFTTEATVKLALIKLIQSKKLDNRETKPINMLTTTFSTKFLFYILS